MDANTLLGIASQSRYLRAVDVGDGAPFTIDHVTVETFKQDKGADREKGVVWFRGEDRGLVLNVTLTVILRELFGVDLEGWKGKTITLHNDKSVRRGGKAVGGIRIKSSPDIAQDVSITAGGNAFSKGTRYTIRAERPAPSRSQTPSAPPMGRPAGSGDPLLGALRSAGLTVAQFDTWADSAGKPVHRAMDGQSKRMAAEWIDRGGSAVIAKASSTDSDDPMAV
jgi:hypothetical protein